MSRLKASKCPSCKIVFLRSVQGAGCRKRCPTCDMDFTCDRDSKLLGGADTVGNSVQVVNQSKRVSKIRIGSKINSDETVRGHGTRRRNTSFHPVSQNLLLPARTPIGNHSHQGGGNHGITTSDTDGLLRHPKCTLDTLRKEGDCRGTLPQTSGPTAASITSHMPTAHQASSPISPDLDFLSNSKTKDEGHESSSLHLPEILSSNAQRSDSVQTSHSSSRLSRIKQLFSSSLWSRKSSPRSDCSSASSGKGLELPPVLRRKKNSYEDNGSDISLSGDSLPSKKLTLTSVDNLRKEYNTAQQNNNYSNVQEMFVNTFSSREEICLSFKDWSTNKDNDCTDQPVPPLGLDLSFLHYAYSVLMELPQGIQNGVMRAIITGILKESRGHVYRLHTLNTVYLRSHLCLIENPQFYSIHTYVVFAQLLMQLSQMSPQSHQCFVVWMQTHYSQEWLRALVDKVQQLVSVRLFPPNTDALPPSSKCRWWISSAVKVLALINEANGSNSNTDTQPRISHKEFYNTTLDYTDLMDDFYSWQNPQSHTKGHKFSFCQYPFILSMAAKQTILQRDSEHQMLIMAKKSLTEKLEQNQIPDTRNFFLNLTIRRSHLVQDSIYQLMQKQRDLKKRVKVTFSGEPGLDMGGLTKEWFLLLMKEIFQPEYGLFTYHEDSGYYWFHPGGPSGMGDNQDEYHLLGLLMGLAVYNNILLDLHFPSCCYKKLLTPSICPWKHSTDPERFYDGPEIGVIEPCLGDLIEAMPTIGSGLKELAHDRDVEELCHTFQVSRSAYDETFTTELVPNGKDVHVTSENREEFVRLYLDHLLNQSIKKQFTAFYLGFHKVCDSNALMLLRPEELETLICGCPEVDMIALQGITQYDGYSEADITIKNFWAVVHGFNLDEQRKLLLYMTGTYRTPIEGISGVHFKISKLPLLSPSNTSVLPVAHTCFNQLMLPPYKTKKRLREKLLIAISNTEGFGIT